MTSTASRETSSDGSASAAAASRRSLECTQCRSTFPWTQRYKCPTCGGILDVTRWFSSADVAHTLTHASHTSMWDFAPLLPVCHDVPPVSLGEGWTPLVPLERCVPSASEIQAFAKLESMNPTGSFKDRPVSVAMNVARAWKVDGVITASSGNAGAAVSAHAARAGLPAVVLVPDSLPSAKADQIALHGATLVPVTGTFSRAYELAHAWASDTGWYNVTSTLLSAFPTEGNKTVAYELYRQLGRAPDWVVIPVSSGPLLVGCWKGFVELRDAGLTERVPRMVAVQASGCAPIAQAFRSGDAHVEPWKRPETVASGIRDGLEGYADDGTLTLQRVRDSGGMVLAVSDEAILEASRQLAHREGIAAEPTGAVGMAGVQTMLDHAIVRPGETLVCLVTGHGLKDMPSWRTNAEDRSPIDPILTALQRRLSR